LSPYVPEGFSPNNDGFNDQVSFKVIHYFFDMHELKIFSATVLLIFIGDNDKMGMVLSIEA
jgi:hypothetical protein